ncbi:hypothetical protein DYU11_20120 [Fibrisoma montanum]|uniref:Uncharacterized protein n=2 Tax=Fibrisoma montanum TaxID=2305895 RepID=A0A418M3N6_9BACT|nr:hypothetical protein DYU11_20120 [Fibrisoma montanum]
MGKDGTLITERSYVASDLLAMIEPTMVSYAEAIELYHACQSLDTCRAVIDLAHRGHLPLWAAWEVWRAGRG